jgi:hypothetical protein
MMTSTVNFMVGAALAIGAAIGSAQAAEVKFSGSFLIKSVGPGCSPDMGPGVNGVMLYWPPKVGTNGRDSSIVLQNWGLLGAVHNYILENGSLVGSTFKTVIATIVYTDGGGGGDQFDGQMRITSQSPAAPSSSTPAITLSGNIKNWHHDPDCTIGFSAVLARTPNID